MGVLYYVCQMKYAMDKVTFIYAYKLDVLTPALFPSPLLGTFS